MKLEIGDTVKDIGRVTNHYGLIGTVVEVLSTIVSVQFISFKHPIWYWESDLEKVEKT